MEVKINASTSHISNTDSNDERTPSNPENDPPLNWMDRIKLLLSAHWRGIVCVLAPFILIPIHLSFPPKGHQWCAYTLVLMAVYWVTECIPLAVTSFLPVIIFPLTGIMTTRNTCECYMNDTIMMFYGSLVLACAVEQSGLHMRLALLAIRVVGYSHYRLLFAMCFVTMFISMWITNTAATTMMVPINFALLKVFEEQNMLTIYDTDSSGEKIASDITTCYFCAATFSATIGGIGTLVGTATNLVFKGLFTRVYTNAPEYLSFPKFFAFALPYMLLLEIATYLYLLVVYFGFLRPKSKAAERSKITPEAIEAAKRAVDEELKKIGRITFWEILVIILFLLAILLFFCHSPQIFTGWGDAIVNYYGIKDQKFVGDSATALMVGFLMMLLPYSLSFFDNCKATGENELPKKKVRSVLDWTTMNSSLPYSFMFLLGGGFALSKAATPQYTNLNGEIGKLLKSMSKLPNSIIILLIIIFTVFITNFASNVAVCTVISPIVMQLVTFMNILHMCQILIVQRRANLKSPCRPRRSHMVTEMYFMIENSAVMVLTGFYRLMFLIVDVNDKGFRNFDTDHYRRTQRDKIKLLYIIFEAKEINQNPLWYNLAAGLSSSYCFCLPVGTPGNLIVQGAVNVPTSKMIKAGFGPTISTILLTWFCLYFWAPVIWPDLKMLPDWIQN